MGLNRSFRAGFLHDDSSLRFEEAASSLPKISSSNSFTAQAILKMGPSE
jgi:hypothetical protein